MDEKLYKHLLIIPVKNDLPALKRCLSDIRENLSGRDEALIAVAVNGEVNEENLKTIETVQKRFSDLNIALYDYTVKGLPQKVHKTNQHLGEIRTRAVKDSIPRLSSDATIYIIDCDCLLSPGYLTIGETLIASGSDVGISDLRYIPPHDDQHIQKLTSEMIRQKFDLMVKNQVASETFIKAGLKESGSKFWHCRHRAFQVNFTLKWFMDHQMLLDPGPHMLNIWTKMGAKIILCYDQVISSEFRDSDRVTAGIGNDAQNAISHQFNPPPPSTIETLKKAITENLVPEDFSTHMEILMGVKSEADLRKSKTHVYNKIYNIVVNNRFDRLIEVLRTIVGPSIEPHRDTLFSVVVVGGATPDNEKSSQVEKSLPPGIAIARHDFRQSLLSENELRAAALRYARENHLADRAVIMEVHI